MTFIVLIKSLHIPKKFIESGFFNTLTNLDVIFVKFKSSLNVFKFVISFNKFHNKNHMCWNIQKSFWFFVLTLYSIVKFKHL
jgi:hypothetical protein